MKKFKERMAERAGFTLVELIVVIAILGILAAVAVPAYTGYIEKANQAADIVTVDAVKTAAQSALATKGEVTKVVVEETSVKATLNIDGKPEVELLGTATTGYESAAADFKLFFTDTSITFAGKVDGKAVATATWEDGQNNNEWKFEAAASGTQP